MYATRNDRPTMQAHNCAMARKTFQPTMIRHWRNARQLTLEQLAARVEEVIGKPTTHATISRIERGKIGYTQQMLEAIAVALSCQPADLIMRHPPGSDEYTMWTIFEGLKPKQRKRAARLLQAIQDADDDAA